MKFLKILSAAIFISTMISCSARVVATQPEAVVVERPAPPFTDAVWIDNEYVWRGGTYVVVPGHYVRHAGVWAPGRWVKVRNGFRWHRGYWR